MKIDISSDVFAAVALFRGLKDTRHYINGVFLESGVAGARLIATDGQQVAIFKIDGKYPEASVILPDNIVLAVKQKNQWFKNVTIEFNDGHLHYDKNNKAIIPRNVLITCGGVKTIGLEIVGKFPDYRRTVPLKADGVVAQYNPARLH